MSYQRKNPGAGNTEADQFFVSVTYEQHTSHKSQPQAVAAQGPGLEHIGTIVDRVLRGFADE